MCGRIRQSYTAEQLKLFHLAKIASNLQPRYNIAPTTQIDVVRAAEDGRELVKMRWGLVPFFWKKSLKEVPATFNARAETVAEKPMFREAFKRRRCIVPVSGFYEWTGGKGDRQPHLFTDSQGAPILPLAGLWDHWRDPATAEAVESCTIIVSGCSAWMQPYHDRMPVILDPAGIDAWMDGSMGADALRPAPEDALQKSPVSKALNKAGQGDTDPAMLELAG